MQRMANWGELCAIFSVLALNTDSQWPGVVRELENLIVHKKTIIILEKRSKYLDLSGALDKSDVCR